MRTADQPRDGDPTDAREADEPVDGRTPGFEIGFVAGILVGEGHFGGDGRVPQVTLRMHTRHRALFDWLVAHFGGRLYGPYHHGGRDYLQWMVRGTDLRQRLVPRLDAVLGPDLDEHAWARYQAMKETYRIRGGG